ncbi:MAG: hypothetical protein Q8P72_02635 [Candidatus Roizmanbacteria bacterium]|nr:hypothetical protein [Candidatus Roizmanbacteria bacterium]
MSEFDIQKYVRFMDGDTEYFEEKDANIRTRSLMEEFDRTKECVWDLVKKLQGRMVPFEQRSKRVKTLGYHVAEFIRQNETEFDQFQLVYYPYGSQIFNDPHNLDNDGVFASVNHSEEFQRMHTEWHFQLDGYLRLFGFIGNDTSYVGMSQVIRDLATIEQGTQPDISWSAALGIDSLNIFLVCDPIVLFPYQGDVRQVLRTQAIQLVDTNPFVAARSYLELEDTYNRRVQRSGSR